jgi:hypothetical protein
MKESSNNWNKGSSWVTTEKNVAFEQQKREIYQQNNIWKKR